MHTDVPYRSIFNRSRTIIFLHPNPSEISEIRDVFHSRGFQTNLSLTTGEFSGLAAQRQPDAVVAYANTGHAAELVGLLRDIAKGTRIYLVTEEVPVLADIVRAARNGALAVFAHPVKPTEGVMEVESDLSNDLHRNASGKVMVGGLTSLTNREREVLDLILRGGSNKDAGKILHISPRTVEVHRSRVMRKLGAHNTAEMVRIALGM